MSWKKNNKLKKVRMKPTIPVGKHEQGAQFDPQYSMLILFEGNHIHNSQNWSHKRQKQQKLLIGLSF